MYSFISKAMKRVPSNERACDVCLYGYELPHSIEYIFSAKFTISFFTDEYNSIVCIYHISSSTHRSKDIEVVSIF